ncbi:unnamed protein product [Caenorhabditis auriculariae]|uniref:E3 ubiquitin protein ligase n=1 Tax=Caenorhabditis auriculariae TaxID=2777116 RepID=A0A8S1HWH9_9PELO|nr:unnamed protein product [Caenorhabditis auriculariae]
MQENVVAGRPVRGGFGLLFRTKAGKAVSLKFLDSRMSKRSNEGSDGSDDSQHGDEPSAKRKRVSFESIRLSSVSGVNDLWEKQTRFQVYKLSEQLRYKNKLLKDREREMERLRQRQETDENTSCTINRHWTNLDAQLRCIIRSAILSESEIAQVDEDGIKSEKESSSFLSQVVQMDTEQSELTYDNRVTTSVHLLNRIMQQSAKKVELLVSFNRKVNEISELSPSTSEDSKDTKLEIVKEVVEANSRLTEENLTLSREVARYQQELSTVRLQFRKKEDECEILTAKNAEFATELEELKFDYDKLNRLNNKLDYRLYTLAKEITVGEIKGRTANGQTNGSPSSFTVDSKELEALKLERDDQIELVNRRGQEISELNERIQTQSAEISRLKQEALSVSRDNLENCKEYVNLRNYYAIAMQEVERISTDLQETCAERDFLRQKLVKRVEDAKNDEDASIQKIMASSELLNAENLKLKAQNEMIKTEFEQTLNAHENALAEAKQSDIKVIFASMKTQNKLLNSDIVKFKKRFRETFDELARVRREFARFKWRIENSVVIELEHNLRAAELFFPDCTYDRPDTGDTDGAEDGASQENGNFSAENEMLAKIARLTEELRKYRDSGSLNDPEYQDRIELISREKRLKQENEKMAKKIKEMAERDAADRQRLLEIEAQKSINQRLKDVDILRLEIDKSNKEQKVLSEEIDSIGQALEDLQVQNQMLVAQNSDKQAQIMTMMNDRIVATQTEQKLHEQIVVLEQQQNVLNREARVLKVELTSASESEKNLTDTITLRISENTKNFKVNEFNRKKLNELGFAKDDLQSRTEKLETQVKELQEVVASKTSQNEIMCAKRRRLEEELNFLKKKNWSAPKKSEKLGSTDAVLNEEIRELKDLLTCPSCKVNRKDAILTKCFHVFCLQCLKTRYDTRQRKCPKCNAGFGANDFHRIYIS